MQLLVYPKNVAHFFINMAHATERRETFEQQWAMCAYDSPIPLTRIEGPKLTSVDSGPSAAFKNDFPQDENTFKVMSAMLLHLPVVCWQRAPNAENLSVGEVGCWAAHAIALNTFLDTGATFGVIFEDDTRIIDPRRFHDRMQRLVASPWQDIQILRLSGENTRSSALVVDPGAKGGVPLIVSVLKPRSGANAYVVTRDGARQILGVLKLSDGKDRLRPFDKDLQRPFLSSMTGYLSEPLAMPNEHAKNSEILALGHETRVSDKIEKSESRIRYRQFARKHGALLANKMWWWDALLRGKGKTPPVFST